MPSVRRSWLVSTAFRILSYAVDLLIAEWHLYINGRKLLILSELLMDVTSLQSIQVAPSMHSSPLSAAWLGSACVRWEEVLCP